LKEEGDTKKIAEKLKAKSMSHFFSSYPLPKSESTQIKIIDLEAKAGSTPQSLSILIFLKKKSILFLFSGLFPLHRRIGKIFIAPLSQLRYIITSRFCSSFLIKIFLVKQNEKIFDQKSVFLLWEFGQRRNSTNHSKNSSPGHNF